MHEETSMMVADVLSFQMSVIQYKIGQGPGLKNGLALNINHEQVWEDHPQGHGIGGGTLSTNGAVMVKVIIPVITV